MRYIVIGVAFSLICISAKSQKRYIILDSSLRVAYTRAITEIPNDSNNLAVNLNKIEEIKETFKDWEKRPDIRAMMAPYETDATGFRKNLEGDKAMLKSSSEGIIKFVRTAGGVPVIWTYLQPGNGNYYLTDTYSLDGDKLVIKTSTPQPLK